MPASHHARSRRNGNPVNAGNLLDLARMPQPIAPEAEVAVLGALLIDPQGMGDLIDSIKPDDFGRQAHAAIWESMVRLYESNRPVDVLGLISQLQDRRILDDVGGEDYLIQLAEAVPDASVLASAAAVVRRKATARALLDAATRIVHHVHDSQDNMEQAIDLAQQELFAVAQDRTGREAVNMMELMQEQIAMIDSREGQVPGLPTGYPDLDEKLGGLQAGELILLAARPSMGKTALALNIAENIALCSKQTCMLFSLEMSRQQISQIGRAHV